MKEHKDTLTPRAVSIAQRVLAHPLASALSPSTRERLQLVANNDERLRFGSYALVDVEFRRADTSIQLTVRCEEEYTRRDFAEKDEEGNEWNTYKLWTELNWPCHGSCSPTIAIARFSFYRQVTELAAELEADFCQTGYRNQAMRMGRTAKEIKDAEEKQAAEKIGTAIQRAMESNRAGMRVGSLRAIKLAELEGVPDGEYEHPFDGTKLFKLVVKSETVRFEEGETIVRTGMLARSA